MVELFETWMAILQSATAEIRLQIFDQQRRLAGRGYDGRVVLVESQIDVAGRRKHVLYIQDKPDR
jgi:hypothetical protein